MGGLCAELLCTAPAAYFSVRLSGPTCRKPWPGLAQRLWHQDPVFSRILVNTHCDYHSHPALPSLGYRPDHPPHPVIWRPDGSSRRVVLWHGIAVGAAFPGPQRARFTADGGAFHPGDCILIHSTAPAPADGGRPALLPP